MSTPHRVTFFAQSTSVTAAAMTETLGLEPDDVTVRGSKDPNRPRPRHHIWKITDDSDESYIGDQARAVVDRLRPHLDGLKRLAADDEIDVGMSIFRELGSATRPIAVGWHLDHETLSFLASVGAEIDCDEYLVEPTFADALHAWIYLRREHWDRFVYRRSRRRSGRGARV